MVLINNQHIVNISRNNFTIADRLAELGDGGKNTSPINLLYNSKPKKTIK